MSSAARVPRRPSPKAADSQVKRAADRFALVAAAGEFAIEAGILPWEPSSADKSAAQMLSNWIGQRGGLEPTEVTSGIAQVRRFIEAHGEARFTNVEGDDRLISNRAGFRRVLGDKREWIVLSEAWRQEVASGHDPGLLARALAERGMLKAGGDGKPQIKHRLPGIGNTRSYVLINAVFEGGEDA